MLVGDSLTLLDQFRLTFCCLINIQYALKLDSDGDRGRACAVGYDFLGDVNIISTWYTPGDDFTELRR